MKHIILSALLAFGLGCQTTKFKKQARKGWQRVDQEWFGRQAKAKISGPEKAASRTPAASGEFICKLFFTEDIHRAAVRDYFKKIEKWTNDNCNPDKNFSTNSGINSDFIGIHSQFCCIAK